MRIHRKKTQHLAKRRWFATKIRQECTSAYYLWGSSTNWSRNYSLISHISQIQTPDNFGKNQAEYDLATLGNKSFIVKKLVFHSKSHGLVDPPSLTWSLIISDVLCVIGLLISILSVFYWIMMGFISHMVKKWLYLNLSHLLLSCIFQQYNPEMFKVYLPLLALGEF